LKDGDDAEWLRLRYTLWPHHTQSELEQEMACIRANLHKEAVFVAECADGVLCGMIEVSIHATAKGCHTDKVGYLEGWFVDSEWRNQGIGRKLVEAAELWSRSQGCFEMASDTTSAFPLSPQAHERLGYQEIERCFYYRKDLI
jgi:aminoglycoside 6'-N-acetyltransferase I